jgi:4-hydroxybenzoate polyprenyltransferase
MANLGHYLSMIKFSHSIFALPFALIAFLVSSDGIVEGMDLAWIVVCMVAARSAAMAFNRLVDRKLDAENPRTAGREIPAGVVSPRGAGIFIAVAVLVFVLACWQLNRMCLYMSGPVLLLLLGYSYAKRFTSLAHLWLGVCLGIAPVAASVAVTGRLDASLWGPSILGLGVALWVMGFDILYACQDEVFDRQRGLHSIPAALGRKAALRISRLAHLLAAGLFFSFGVESGLGAAYHSGVAVVAVVLLFEHRLISPADMSRVNLAFFTMNGVVSLIMLLCTVFDLYLL